ncbi:MAG TPA: phosphatase PAP2 family protein [Firmicutes bacterium]|nr:phosphatase PAP2 family protein [Bacillota bacterium]
MTLNELISHSALLFQQYGALGLSVVAFAEASFFPIPPDIILIPLCLTSTRLSLWYAFLCTVSSTLGGFFGYLIGARAGRPLLEKFAGKERTRQTETLFGKYGGWAVLIAALTPIPYKVFTIAAGVFRIDKMTFLWASIIGRGIRFFLEALLIMFMGQAATQFLARYSGPLTFGIAGLLIIGYLLARYVKGLLSMQRSLHKARILIENRLRRLTAPELELAIFMVMGLALGATFLFIFAEIAEDLYENELSMMDNTLTMYVRGIFGPGAMNIMRFLSIIGSPIALLGLSVVATYSLYRHYGHWTGQLPSSNRILAAITPLMAVTGGGILESILKVIFERPRPEYPRLVEAAGFSFPSGHATISTAVLGVLAYEVFTIMKRGSARLLILLLTLILILMIGISRIYLGVHYPSDVLAGFAIGGFWAICCIIASEMSKRRLGN